MIPSFPPVAEHPFAGSALAIFPSGIFGELKSGRNEGYVSLVPNGYRTSLCRLCHSKKYFVLFRGMKIRGMKDKIPFPTGHRNSLCGLCFSNQCFGPFRGTEE
jgi:hypothetical protein